MSEFPRQGALTNRPFSLPRDTQFRTYLELLANEAGWTGVISGGGLIDNGGVSIKIAAGVYASKGVVKDQTTETTYNGLPSDGTSQVWLRVVRTAATQTDPSLSDTFAIEAEDTTTGSPPAADAGWFSLGYAVTVGGDITSLTYQPDWVQVHASPALTPSHIQSHRSFWIPAGAQAVVYGDFRVDGDLQIDGDIYLLEA